MHEVDVRIADAKGLIFDCDGTLLDNREVYALAWADGFAAVGARISAAWHAPRSGLSEQMLLAAFEREWGVALEQARVVAAMRASYRRRLLQVRALEPVLAIARRWSGVMPLAVASSGSRELVLASLRQLGVEGLFDSIVTLDDVGVAKPAPDLYLEAARRLGLLPVQCLAFEDSVHGMEAARRAGIGCVDIAVLLSPNRL